MGIPTPTGLKRAIGSTERRRYLSTSTSNRELFGPDRLPKVNQHVLQGELASACLPGIIG
jgi:hypothetical protein